MTAALLTVWEGMFALIAVVFLRVAALSALLPAFGERSIPVRVKLGIAVAFTMILLPVLQDRVPQVESLGNFAFLAMTETVSGALLGLGLRFFVFALQTAGSMAAQATSLSQLLGQAAEPMPGISHVLTLAGLTLAVTAGLHVDAAELLIRSYDILPLGTVPLASDTAGWGIGRVRDSFAMAFRFAAPFLIASTLYNLALGVINRAMPQLMVAFVGAPLITAGGLVLLFMVAVPILVLWQHALGVFMADPFGAGR